MLRKFLERKLIMTSAMFICFVFVAVDSALANKSTEIIFAHGARNFIDGSVIAVNPQNEFDCQNKIYAIVSVLGLEIGKHVLEVQWVNPSDQVERSRTWNIQVQSLEQKTQISSYIAFYGSSGLLSLLDPSAGFEEFIGKWTLNVVVDKQKLGDGNFHLLC